METMDAIAKRHSTRGFDGRPVPKEVLDLILREGCAAPVGMADYESMHLTVVQNESVLRKMTEAVQRASGDSSRDLFYGAPTVVLVSSSGGKLPEIAMANAACISQTMLLAAADQNVQSVYVWGAVVALREQPELKEACGLPKGFEPMASVALGFEKEPCQQAKSMEMKMDVNWV